MTIAKYTQVAFISVLTHTFVNRTPLSY